MLIPITSSVICVESRRSLVAPRIDTSLFTACGLFPYPFRGQAVSSPFAIDQCLSLHHSPIHFVTVPKCDAPLPSITMP